MKSVDELYEGLRQFTGCETPTQHRLMRSFYFTEGIVWLRKEAGCFWLIDEIASFYFGGGDAIRRIGDDFASFHVWTLKKFKAEDSHGAELFAQRDTDEPKQFRRSIPFTDFPFDESGTFKLYCGLTQVGDDLGFLLMLPSEY